MDDDNRFLRVVREHREEQRRLREREPQRTYDSDNRFQRAYIESKHSSSPSQSHSRRESADDRFACLVDSTPSPRSHRSQSLVSEGSSPKYPIRSAPPVTPTKVITPKKSETDLYSELFPSLPSAPTTPKIPQSQTPIYSPKLAPLREEVSTIILNAPEVREYTHGTKKFIVRDLVYENEIKTQTIRKAIGGNWSERVKYAISNSESEQHEDDDEIELDADGFPVMR